MGDRPDRVYRSLTDTEKDQVALIREKGMELQLVLEDLESSTGSSKELSEARTRLDEAVMWATRHVGR